MSRKLRRLVVDGRTFDDGEARHAGYPATGVVWTSEEPKTEANLNAPGVVRLLLERAIAAGWEPDQMRQPTLIEDGFALLR